MLVLTTAFVIVPGNLMQTKAEIRNAYTLETGLSLDSYSFDTEIQKTI